MPLSIVHWLIMMATKGIDHLEIFLLHFRLKQFNISAEVSLEKGVTLLVKQNDNREAGIMCAMSFLRAYVYYQ